MAMGIKHLFQIVKEEAPEAIKEGEIKNHFGRKVAIVSSLVHRYPLEQAHRLTTSLRAGCVRLDLLLHLHVCYF